MATRSTVMISKTFKYDQPDNPNNGVKWYQYYHHWDGYEHGVGLDLVHKMLNLLDSGKLSDLFKENEDPTYTLDYVLTQDYNRESADDLHGDIEYLYHIDCDKKQLVMYERRDWDKETHDNWQEWSKNKILMDMNNGFGKLKINIG